MSRIITTSALARSFAGLACAQQDEAPWQEDLNAFLEVLHAEHDSPYFHTPPSRVRAGDSGPSGCAFRAGSRRAYYWLRSPCGHGR